jgi:hypothetical protein
MDWYARNLKKLTLSIKLCYSGSYVNGLLREMDHFGVFTRLKRNKKPFWDGGSQCCRIIPNKLFEKIVEINLGAVPIIEEDGLIHLDDSHLKILNSKTNKICSKKRHENGKFKD